MSTVKTKNVQVGNSGFVSDNFNFYQPTVPDGTFRLANGNVGSTSDILTVTNEGSFSFSGDVSATSFIEDGSPLSSVYASVSHDHVLSDITDLDPEALGKWSDAANGTDIFFDVGNVGIGTSSPTETLSVVGDIGAEGILVDPGFNANPNINFSSNYMLGGFPGAGIVFNSNWNLGVEASDISFYLKEGTLGNESRVLSIKKSTTDSANFGFNVQSPSEAIDVYGNVKASGDFISLSDEKVKKDIEFINDSLSIVDGLTGIYFRYSDRDDDRRRVGLVAQEVEEVLPEVVFEHDGFKSVSYSSVVAVLIEAVKTLSKEVEELKNGVSGIS